MIIKEQITEIRKHIWDNLLVLAPAEIDEYAIKLSILLANMGDEVATSEQDCRKLQAKYFEDGMKGNHAEVMLKASDEYRIYQENKYMLASCEELIKSLKRRQKTLEAEYQNKI